MIAWITEIEISTGYIQQIYSAPGNNIPAHNHDRGDGTRVVHLFDYELPDLNFYGPAQFMEEYKHDGTSWIYKGAKPGNYYTWNGTSWVVDSNTLTTEVRALRTSKLYNSDWTQATDSPLSEEKKTEWRTYRQTLRDIMANLPADLDDPANVPWPTEPA